ncbi:hypothetical protein PV326_002120, partial [Microctonus aethiopoides]
MKLLLETLSFIIGDLMPENNATWDLVLLLRENHCNLLNPEITKESAKTLQLLIAKDHNLYQKLFYEHLKSKFHFSFIIPDFYSEMDRSIKHQMGNAERFQAKKGFSVCLDFGPSITIQNFQLPEYHLFKNYIPESKIASYSVIVPWVQINSTKYRPDMIISVELKCNVTKYGKIKFILMNDKHE